MPEGKSVPAGAYFRVLLCGITGHRQFATDSGLLLLPEQLVATAAAMVRVFAEHGDRTDRKKARLKYLIDRWGMPKFIEETQKKLAFPVILSDRSESEPRGPIDRAGHLGVHAQSQPGLHYIGVVTPVGWVPVDQARALADIADRFGSGEVRLTVWQNLLIPNIPAEHLEAAKTALRKAGLDFQAGRVLSGTVACTGSRGCRFAATDTKGHALELARALDDRFAIAHPLNLHVTGCNNSCAQHYIGDIGLMGEPACVNACPENAIQIEIVNKIEWREDYALAESPGMPPAGNTMSTTRITPAGKHDLVAAACGQR